MFIQICYDLGKSVSSNVTKKLRTSGRNLFNFKLTILCDWLIWDIIFFLKKDGGTLFFSSKVINNGKVFCMPLLFLGNSKR